MDTRRTTRAGALLVATLALLPLAVPAAAATPSGATLTDARRVVTYTGGPFVAPNRTDPIGDGGTQQCASAAVPCDDFALTISLPSNYLTTRPDTVVTVALAAANGTSDYDLYVLDSTGSYVAIGYNSGGKESVEFAAKNGVNRYTVRAVPWSANAAAFNATVTLRPPDPTRDTDGDRVPDVKDACPNTPPRTPVNASGCSGKEAVVPSAPTRPRVVVADIDSAINPYHDFFYQRPSVVTKEVLAALGVKPENVVKLTRTGNFANDRAADAGFWARVKRGERYHFAGTNIIATSLANTTPYLKPTSAKNAHGVGTSAAVLTANPDAIIFFIEANDALGSAESHAAAFRNPAVDIVTTSYGVSVGLGLVPLPEYRAFDHSYEGVVTRGKLHFSSGGNGPGVTALRGGAGPWWSIGVSGIEEGSSEGDTVTSGNLPDFVSDFTQTLPYCMDCEKGTEDVGGTSFSTPRSAGLASKVLLEARRALKHVGGVRVVGGTPVMATNAPRTTTAKCTAPGARCVTNWKLRRSLEQAAWTPDSTAYDPTALDIAVPVAPGAPWLQTAWGDLTVDPRKGVVRSALAELGFLPATSKRVKPAGYCEFQTKVVQARKAWWDKIAPTLPDNPILGGEVPPGGPAKDPFVYCTQAAPIP